MSGTGISSNKPRLAVPAAACDTHMHIYGPPGRYPLARTAAFEPPYDASVEAYCAVQRRLGLERVVVVQPSAYGADNRCTLDAMRAFGAAARGVAVVPPEVSDEELERLTAAGIRGIRYFMLPGGVLPWETLERMAARVAEFGWHVQLQLDGRELAEREALLRRLTGTLVVDHVGKFLEPVPVDHPSFEALLRLVETGRCWIKLSAPYETSNVGPPLYGDVGALAKPLVKAAADRMVWASNWPHPAARGGKPDEAILLDLLLDWAPDEETRHRILVDNPAELYGF